MNPKFKIAALLFAISSIFVAWMSGYDFNHRNVNAGMYTFVSLFIIAVTLLLGYMP